MFFVKFKKPTIVCSAVSLPGSSPSLPPKGNESIIKAAKVTALKVITSKPIQFYGVTIAGTMIPTVHKILIAEKNPTSAAVYIFGALFKGQFDYKSNFEKSVELAAVQSVRLLSAEGKKKIYQEVEARYGRETLAQLKRLVGRRRRGGWGFYAK